MTTLTVDKTGRVVIPKRIREAMRLQQGSRLRVELVAARKAKARRFYTLNGSNFRAFQRDGDPEILSP